MGVITFSTQFSKPEITSQWGQRAYALLRSLGGEEVRKKRLTLLALADAKAAGVPRARVWEASQTCSASIHYSKWLKQPDYAQAYAHLVDNIAAEVSANRDADEIEEHTIAIGEARSTLTLAAPEAAKAARAALSAEVPVYYEGEIVGSMPVHPTRLSAAKFIIEFISNGDSDTEATTPPPAYDVAEISDDELPDHLLALARAAASVATGESYQRDTAQPATAD